MADYLGQVTFVTSTEDPITEKLPVPRQKPPEQLTKMEQASLPARLRSILQVGVILIGALALLSAIFYILMLVLH